TALVVTGADEDGGDPQGPARGQQPVGDRHGGVAHPEQVLARGQDDGGGQDDQAQPAPADRPGHAAKFAPVGGPALFGVQVRSRHQAGAFSAGAGSLFGSLVIGLAAEPS
ncbi:hypothetical protein LTR94_034434, partial [Friedmanniomyces endolithicus]